MLITHYGLGIVLRAVFVVTHFSFPKPDATATVRFLPGEGKTQRADERQGQDSH